VFTFGADTPTSFTYSQTNACNYPAQVTPVNLPAFINHLSQTSEISFYTEDTSDIGSTSGELLFEINVPLNYQETEFTTITLSLPVTIIVGISCEST
jgi:hypothetical protein